ncbi:4-hydroxythreonine-4-phosphate dehydrogenase 2 [Devosia pacifica]|uniref:4-hydroxythreonine-4-phosphate dehydrogenase 2 n=1 Tax=Devosia pacifica TaxID=1335967 RepID=A0A918SFJ5_9HYPH|nr:4-hydroxythreonine-4-phosphate dehydrogenase PdxA [Devosia pacifica]GHA36170.1 4-hydroxythreonine-4-phosphate dehydrogenase 2 [Devosia pacifica]
MSKPVITIVLGDPGGVGPELVGHLLADPDTLASADVLVIADQHEFDEGLRISGASLQYATVSERPGSRPAEGVTLWNFRGSETQPFSRAEVSAANGRYALDTLEQAVLLTQKGIGDAFLFAPLNKSALHLGGLDLDDEGQMFARVLGSKTPHGELNVLDNLWTSRVTSHVALRDVSALITEERIHRSIKLLHDAVTDAGIASPRIAICGLNPHNGENGSFGREELDVIMPAVESAKRAGYPVEGPYPADTIFLKAADYDAVVTMYHDQGQIALKLLGFSRGVTVAGGLPIPICTPAHGTAFDIYGKGQANVGATRAAFGIAVKMANRRLACEAEESPSAATA